MNFLECSELRRAPERDSWEGGGEDWPDAYRHCPMCRGESLACVVAFWHEEWAEPAYQLYAGLLFGLPLAVTLFNRYSRFVEAAGRRLIWALVFRISDWSSSAGSAQWAYRTLNAILGTPSLTMSSRSVAPFTGSGFPPNPTGQTTSLV